MSDTALPQSPEMTRMPKPPYVALTVAQAPQVFKLLSDESRLRILLLLKDRGEVNVTELCELTGNSQPAVSHHLALMRMTGIVACRRSGKLNYYRLESDVVRHLLGVVKF